MHVFLQEIDGDREQNNILHEERNVAHHGGKAAVRNGR